jgi:predicted 2-oxoglutarate/Fe(II)-dependent dioxygenase YbiX
MGEHADSMDTSDKYHPLVSGVFYINDDYEGGEIEFSRQKIKIKPSAGSIVMFPSYQPYFHRPLPVVNGVKYMIPFFWYPTKTEWEWGNKE